MFGIDLARPCDACGRLVGGGYSVCPKCKIYLCLCCRVDIMYKTKIYPVKCPMCTGKLWRAHEEKELQDVAKDKDEFVAQWEHNLVKFPEINNEVFVIWHYGLNSDVKDGSYKGKEIGEYLQSKTQMPSIKYRPNLVANFQTTPKLVLLPFFRDTPAKLEKELGQISSDKVSERRSSMLYGALSELIKRLMA
jgi:hypothetical protein